MAMSDDFLKPNSFNSWNDTDCVKLKSGKQANVDEVKLSMSFEVCCLFCDFLLFGPHYEYLFLTVHLPLNGTSLQDQNISRLLDKGKLNYLQVSIIQASDLKERLEEMKVKRDEVTISSVNNINMYLSIKLSKVKQSVRFFAREITTTTNKTINLCLELICFGMSCTSLFMESTTSTMAAINKNKG